MSRYETVTKRIVLTAPTVPYYARVFIYWTPRPKHVECVREEIDQALSDCEMTHRGQR